MENSAKLDLNNTSSLAETNNLNDLIEKKPTLKSTIEDDEKPKAS